MGLYDRDYYRGQPGGLPIRWPRTAVGTILALNVALYVVGLLTPATRPGTAAEGRWLIDAMAMHSGQGEWPPTLSSPALWWQLVAYGFAHSPRDIGHILFNMLGLLFLGRDVESRYGRNEFGRLYVALLVFGGLVWALLNLRDPAPTMLIGASGAVSGVVVLFALNFPRRQLALFFVLPVPAWVAGVLLVGMDVLGALGREGESNIAYSVHLAGAALAIAYYHWQWNFGRVTRLPGEWLGRLRRPRLRVVRPADDSPSETDGGADELDSLDAEVDRILEKIYRDGEASLTRKERRILEQASRQLHRRLRR